MKVIYVGYRDWAFQIVSKLAALSSKNWHITSILTTEKPEAPYDNLPLVIKRINPNEIGSKNNMLYFQKQKPDVILFYGWSWYIPASLYEKYLCLVLHTSPLPKYRGGSPLQHQIINGEKKSAVSIFQVVERIDEGDIYVQKEFSLEGNMDGIFASIVKAGTAATLKLLDGLSKGTLRPKKQKGEESTYFKRRKKSESELTIDDLKRKSAEELYNFIRALGDPYPNAYFVCRDGKKLYFTGAKLEPQNL